MGDLIVTRAEPIRFMDGDQIGTKITVDVGTVALETDLRAAIKGEVRFDSGSRGMYAHDASNYRMVPIGVVIPKDEKDVIAAVAAARKHGAPVLARGGGTGIPGQSVNAALMLDFSKYMHGIVEIDAEGRTARVQPGIVLDTLRDAAEKHHLTFGPDPATHSRCTLGGMIGNNSCGIHSVMAGRTCDNIEELDVLLYDGARMRVGATSEEELERIINEGGRRGEIYRKLRDLRDKYADLIRERYPKIPRRVSGYNLDELLPEKGFNVARALVGSECTCVLVLEATCKLVESPPVRSLVVFGFEDIAAAGDHAAETLKFGPIGCEGLDDTFIDDMKKKGMHPGHIDLLPPGRAWLMIEFGGKDKNDSDGQAKKLMEFMKEKEHLTSMKLYDDPPLERFLWSLREEGLGATAHIPGEKDNHEGWEDSAVRPENVGKYLRDFQDLLNKYEYRGALYGHFGDGCIHTRLDFDLETADGIAKYRRFIQEAADLVVKHGGSLSGEHGDGQARGELLTRMYGEELVQAFREFKEIWDPDWKMNPGKVVAPFRADENLFLGTDYHPHELEHHFQYPDDHHSFTYATRRCVGAGVCRRKGESGGTMCPSYMVTLEEKHSTRGRARLLFEMAQGEVIKDGWKSEEVKDALDLCLACKGCKGECPVQVDMATYKGEFLSHYYEGKPRPRHAYAFGHIHRWAELASHMPEVVNFTTQTPGLREIAKIIAGMHPDRKVPKFAPQTFKAWFARRGKKNLGKPGVILWADTFNNHFHPATAVAAVEVLEAAGFRVEVPEAHLCCGRPLYDYGFLDQAKGLLRHILDTLATPIEEGVPVVVLEPSCSSVLRDELVNLFPNDANARRLKAQTYLLSEFLAKKAPDFSPPKLSRKAVVHGHCHHKSLWKMDDEESLLKKLGLDYALPDTGCCGMAGAFGFEGGEHFDVAMKCGERVLLPAVRDADKETLIIADGFSCREQIAQGTDRHALHPAQVIQMALHEGEDDSHGAYPERKYIVPPEPEGSAARTAAAVGAGALLVGAAAWWWNRHRSA